MGTGDFYRVLEKLPVVRDAVVIDASGDSDVGGGLILLVVLTPGTVEDAEEAIANALREDISPRHVPDEIIEVAALPHTLNGKRLEVPIKRLFLGAPVAAVCDEQAVDDQEALYEVARIATAWRAARAVSTSESVKVLDGLRHRPDPATGSGIDRKASAWKL